MLRLRRHAPALPPSRSLFIRIGLPAVVGLAILFGESASVALAAKPSATPTRVRRYPTALIPLDHRLLVANQGTGTVSVIDTRSNRVIDEAQVSGRLAFAVRHPGDAHALVLDDDKHRLLAVSLTEPRPTVNVVADVPPFPVRLTVDEQRHRVYVTSLWSRCLTILEFDKSFGRVTGRRRVDLPFAPRELLLLDDHKKLLVADAFGGRMAILDVTADTKPIVRRLPAHNIRGLARSPDGATVYISHQTLDPGAWTNRDSVHWGIVMSNTLRAVRIEALLDSECDVLEGGWLEQHGLVGGGAGDPGPVWFDDQGRLAVALSGVGKVAVTGASYALTLKVGHRPMALAALGDDLYVANQLDDSVTIIDLRSGAVRSTIRLGPAGPLSARQRGERLFFDARLSHDGWMSCHSCHSDGHTSGLLADTIGDGDYGSPKRIPSLLGIQGTGPWAWNGSAESLEGQIQKSVLTTMHGAKLSNAQVHDLAVYLRSLVPPPTRSQAGARSQAETGPRAEAGPRVEAALVRRGREVFEQRDCVDCHHGPKFTSAGTYDVQLADEGGNRLFNPPSLLGVGQRDGFFHDGRAARLEDVVHKVRHQLGDALSEEDAAALLAFLRSL